MRKFLKESIAVAISAAVVFTPVVASAGTQQTVNMDEAVVATVGQTLDTAEMLAEVQNPVGGWSPAEVHVLTEDVDIYARGNDLYKYSRVINAPLDEDSVFVKGANTVGYEALSDEQKEFYKRVDAAAVSFAQSTEDLSTTKMNDEDGSVVYVAGSAIFNGDGLNLDPNDALHAFYAYDYDHPAYYWISNSVWRDNRQIFICTEPDYATANARATVDAMVTSGVENYATLATKAEDTLDKIAIIHDAILSDVNYAWSEQVSGNDTYWAPQTAKWAHNVQGVFDETHNREVVCEGYADAFSLMMNYLGIPNYYIVGTAAKDGAGGGGGHAWNAVSDDGGKTYMYMDLTWDEIGSTSYYDVYFGMPKSDFEVTHTRFKSNSEDPANWLYDINVTFNDTFEGTYYYKAGYYIDENEDDVKAAGLRLVTNGAKFKNHYFAVSKDTSKGREILRNIRTGLGATEGGLSGYQAKYNGIDYFLCEMNDISDRTVDISNAEITMGMPAYAYNEGSEVKPVPTAVSVNGVKLMPGNYTLSYESNTEIGEAAVITVTAAEPSYFTGNVSTTFAIRAAHTLTFQNDDAIYVSSNVAEGCPVAKPKDPVKEGSIFGGWYKDSAFTTAWDFDKDVMGTEDVTLYAMWTVPSHTVTFQNDDAVYATVTVPEGSLVEKPADPTKIGYTFEGWYKENTFTTPWDFEKDTVNADTTIYAKWKKKETSGGGGGGSSGGGGGGGASGGGGGGTVDSGNKQTTVSTNTVSSNSVSSNTVSGNTTSGNSVVDDGGDKDTDKDTLISTDKVTVKSGKSTLTYSIKGNTVTLTKVTVKGKAVKIPDKIKENGKTYKVTKIAQGAFKGNKKITKITIGGNVKQIGESAFEGCTGVKKVVINAKSLKKVGKKAFSGIPENAVIKIKGNAKQKAKVEKLISRSSY